MSAGLYRLLRRRFDRIGQPLGIRSEAAAGLGLTSALIVLVVVGVLLVGAGAWLAMSIDDSETADGGVTGLERDVFSSTPAGRVGNEDETSRNSREDQARAQPVTLNQGQSNRGQANALTQPITPDDRSTASIAPPPVNGLKISSQSWRRGGLGSKALVTFTLRNDNAYAVRDVELACAFSRRDGSHLTDRRRTVPGPVRTKSRKTFAAVHVGFVNVNASKAKCILVTASRI